MDLFGQVPNPIEVANVELNLQTLFRMSGQRVDLAELEERSRILEQPGDPKAKRGHDLLRSAQQTE